jgi:hypothetical protein
VEACEQGKISCKSSHPVAVAIVVANYVPESVALQVAVCTATCPGRRRWGHGLEGLRSFDGHGLERFNSETPRARNAIPPASPVPSPQLFSDLNQWMLKVLLAPRIPELYLSAPRGRYRGASQLAEAAAISVMSAFRFIEQFSKAGMNRWLAANQRSVSEIGVRWALRGKKDAYGTRSALTFKKSSPAVWRRITLLFNGRARV